VREAAVELAVPVHVAAEPGRKPGRHDLDDAAERVAALLAVVDRRDDLPLGVRVGDAHLGDLGRREDRVGLEPA
jgi:hypothetical protein